MCTLVLYPGPYLTVSLPEVEGRGERRRVLLIIFCFFGNQTDTCSSLPPGFIPVVTVDSSRIISVQAVRSRLAEAVTRDGGPIGAVIAVTGEAGDGKTVRTCLL
jgi:hypothetical protein